MIKTLFLFGTRPEAIKMAPLMREMRRRSRQYHVRCCVTGQHRDMLDQVLELFRIQPDMDLNLMTEGQTLEDLTSSALRGLVPVLDQEQPDLVLVQGDTTTTMVSSLASFYKRVRIGHVEAGLRTRNRYKPFPEEINRRITSVLASLHFAPTERARENLLGEGVNPRDVFVTGNTAIDALRLIAREPHPPEIEALGTRLAGGRIVLVTAHRRESHGAPLETICDALEDLARRNADVSFVVPVHPNPHVRRTVNRRLGEFSNLHLVPPLSYGPFVHLMKRSHLLLTDSGGLQEEGPALNKPVLVMREETERPEAIESGTARLVGYDRNTIVEWVERLLHDDAEYRKMATAENPFGDGRASVRIADIAWRRYGASGSKE